MPRGPVPRGAVSLSGINDPHSPHVTTLVPTLGKVVRAKLRVKEIVCVEEIDNEPPVNKSQLDTLIPKSLGVKFHNCSKF